MGKNYDNWERLMEAVMRRQLFLKLSLESSRSPSIRSFDSDSSDSSSFRFDDDVYFTAEEVYKRSEIERIQELLTLQGHAEALVKAKRLDGDLTQLEEWKSFCIRGI